MKLLIIFLLISSNIFSQVWQRPFRKSEDLQWGQHIYKIIEFGQKDEWDNIHWTKWMLNDLLYTNTNNVLDLETQKGLTGVGHFINGTIDSIYFNPDAAQKSCPTGWRLPRIGEWDTLVGNLNWEQKVTFFNKLPGYIGYSNRTINDTIIIKNIIKLNGGFYWSLTDSGDKVWGVEIETTHNYIKGKADKWDFASVRCIKDDENEE